MSQTPPRWDLSLLYSSIDDPAIQKDIAAASLQAERFQKRGKGKIADMTPEDFGKMVAEYESIAVKLEKVSAFAFLGYSVDMNTPATVDFYKETEQKTSEVLEKAHFFEPEVSKLSDEKLAQLMTDPHVRQYEHWINRIRTGHDYILDEATEKKISDRMNNEVQPALRLYEKTKNNLCFNIDGQEATVSDLYAMSFSENAEKRLKAGIATNEAYKNESAVFASIVNTVAQHKQYEDELRGFKTPIESRNRSNQIEDSVVEALVSSVDKAAPDVAHRYYALKAKWAGQEKIGYWDRNAPVSGIEPRKYSFEEAKDIVLSAYREFDPEMGAAAQSFFDEKRIDAEPRPGKQGGEYAMPIINGKPYIKMNFNGTTNDILCLAHELGHGIHYELSQKQGRLGTQMPITVEETASIFGEMLTFNHMLKNEKDPKQRFALLSDKMNRAMLTTFRQIALHHYEEGVHNGVREKGSLTPEEIGKIWTQTQKDTLGPSVINDEQTSSSWAGVPHLLHTPFYVYGYAFGECMTSSLYQVYESGKVEDFPQKYKEMLSKGSTEHYSKLLKPFGLDASKPDFWQQGLGMMKGFVDKLDSLTDKLGMDKTKSPVSSAAVLKKIQTAGR